MAAASAGYEQFHAEATLDTTYTVKLNNVVNTYLDCRQNSPMFNLETQEVFPNFFPRLYIRIYKNPHLSMIPCNGFEFCLLAPSVVLLNSF